MVFNSIPFIVIFPLAVLIFYLIPGRFRYIWLLALSYAFYYMNGGNFAVLLAVCTLITYITGIALSVTDSRGAKKAVLAGAAAVVLITLFVFKYLDFSLSLIGSGLRFNLILPVGISFYTFMSVSYMADVYSGKIQAEKNILKLALYLSFFLSILSGPINRAGDMLPQFSCDKKPSYDALKTGAQKMLWGYFLKLAIAGRLAIVTGNVYSDPDAYTGFSITFTAIAYLFMLYCDFEGYSQIAIGCGYMLGIKMKENFRQPFMSKSMSELWRRWHVSLSAWFRDYLYIPLGGNRRGTARKYLNIFIVLLVSGIWHGANMTFIIWGVLNGLFIIAGQMLLPYRQKLSDGIRSALKSDGARSRFDNLLAAARTVGVYLLSALTFVFFANDSVSSAWSAMSGIAGRFSLAGITELTSLGLGTINLTLTLLMAVFVMKAEHAANRRSVDVPSLIKNIPAAWRWTIYYALIIAILFSANLSGKEFIYSAM